MVSTESQKAMDAAKLAVHEFMSKNGHHDTTVHERVQKAVYHETISRNEHEEVITAVDRESHIDHYHTSIQPITDSETLEEQHSSHILPAEKRTFEHDDQNELQTRLEAEQAKFRDHVEHVEGEHTREVVPVATSEHVHHHVHEIIIPVVNKHTVEPHIVHTLSFTSEIHHHAAQHHATSTLPAVSMAEFLQQVGVLVGREERYDWFEGEPRSVGGWVGNEKNPTGSPVEATTQTSPVQAKQAIGSPSAEKKEPLAQTAPTVSVVPAPPMPVPERRTSMPPAPPADKPSSQPAVLEATKPTTTPTPNSATGPAQAAPTTPGQPAAGRWNLLPMHFSRGDEAGHLPTRVNAHPSVIQSVQAKADQQQQQRQPSVGQPSNAKPAEQPKR